MFSQDMMKSIDPIRPVSLDVLVHCTYWMFACTHVHTDTHSVNLSPDPRDELMRALGSRNPIQLAVLR